jgi:hypothetical protein
MAIAITLPFLADGSRFDSFREGTKVPVDLRITFTGHDEIGRSANKSPADTAKWPECAR